MIKVLELFAGIGACSEALTNLGIEHEIVDAVEIDKYAVQSFNAIHGTNFEPQDITKWDKDVECDLIMHGSPCQDFSVAGLGAGGDKGSGTRSSLMYETLRIVEKLKPQYVIWENVKNLLSKKHYHNFEAYIRAMEDLGYESQYQVLNAKNYGVPQNRERVFTVSIRKDMPHKDFSFPTPIVLDKRLKDVLEDEVEEKFYLTQAQIDRMKNTNFNCSKFETRVQDENEVARTLCARDYKDPKCIRLGGLYDKEGEKHQAGGIYDPRGISATLDTMSGGNREPIIIEDFYKSREVREYREVAPTLRSERAGLKVEEPSYRIRKLTPKECWRLMSFSDASFDRAKASGISNSQLYKQAGNSIVVKVLEAILGNLIPR